MKIKYIPACLLLILCLASCKKIKYQGDVRAYYPEVATTSVRIEPDGSARITGNVLSRGSGELAYVGFCMDTKPHPEMHINQKLVDVLDGTSFTDTFAQLDATKRYYVRAFAANEFGYAYGQDLVIEHAGFDTSLIPCHPAANTMMVETASSTKYDNLPSYNIDEMDPLYYRFSVQSSNYSWGMDFEFKRKPTGGKYTIWESAGGNANTVEVMFYDPNLGKYYMPNGGEIYVEQVDATRIKVWVCHQEAISGRFVTASFTTK
jgi:hypothetical protein